MAEPPRTRDLRRVARVASQLAAAAVLALILLAGLAVLITGEKGIADVRASEVAVRLNHVTGTATPIETPGYHFYVPFLQEIHVIDRNPAELVMRGEEWNGPFVVPRLTVRASDGSSFWFEDLTIQYQIDPEKADLVLADSGPGDAWRHTWLQVHARAILRDEFGRFKAQEVADAAQVEAARGAALEELNRALSPHGLRVTQIVTPKPKFDRTYEQAINARMEVRQKVENLEAQLGLLVKQRDFELAQVDKQQAKESALLVQKLAGLRAGADQAAIQARAKAETYRIDRVSKGEARRTELLAEAAGLEQTHRKAAEGLAAQVEALAARGDLSVREQLVEQLASIRFDILPYSQDSSPTRVEHVTTSAVIPGS